MPGQLAAINMWENPEASELPDCMSNPSSRWLRQKADDAVESMPRWSCREWDLELPIPKLQLLAPSAASSIGFDVETHNFCRPAENEGSSDGIGHTGVLNNAQSR